MISTPEAVKFSNEKGRPAADRLAQLYFYALSVVAEYNANNLAKEFISDTVDDGSDKDGRHPITGDDVIAIITLLQVYITDFESGTNAKLNSVLKVAVNPVK